MNISIIIPAYNVIKYLEEFVPSALYQTYEKIAEIIIVNNNSTDRTLKITKTLKSKHKDIIKVIGEKKKEKEPCKTRS